jgi:hypothetical protein
MGDHIEATRLRVHGPMGEEPISEWDQRVGAMIFDGRPLAEHQLLADKEPAKRINEMLGAAYALVGSGIDAEVAELRSLPTRPGIATPDFTARLVDGRSVRIEVCALTDETEQEYLNALRAIAQRVNEQLMPQSEVWGKSPYFVRFYARLITARDIGPASTELTALLTSEGPTVGRSTTFNRVGPEFPLLHALGTHWARDTHDDRIGVTVGPLRHLLGSSRPRDAFPTLFAQKAARHADYSDGGMIPVWLAMYVRTALTIPYGDVEAIGRAGGMSPHPFQRLIVGSKTIGVIFEEGIPPRWCAIIGAENGP